MNYCSLGHVSSVPSNNTVTQEPRNRNVMGGDSSLYAICHRATSLRKQSFNSATHRTSVVHTQGRGMMLQQQTSAIMSHILLDNHRGHCGAFICNVVLLAIHSSLPTSLLKWRAVRTHRHRRLTDGEQINQSHLEHPQWMSGCCWCCCSGFWILSVKARYSGIARARVVANKVRPKGQTPQ